MKQRSRSKAGDVGLVVGGGSVLALCCGGALVAGAVGFGALAAFLINPWFLIPAMIVGGGMLAWWNRRHSDPQCDLPARGASEQAPQEQQR